MTKVPMWAKALKISDSEFEEWLKLFPSRDHLLSWAIENRRVSEDQYLKWAMAHHNLPLVKREFFDQPPPLELWKKLGKAGWTPTCLPIGSWENLVFIGCLEPPTQAVTIDPQAGFDRAQLFLTPWSVQKKWWSQFSAIQREVPKESADEIEKTKIMPVMAETPPEGLNAVKFEKVESEKIGPQGLQSVQIPPSISLQNVPEGLENTPSLEHIDPHGMDGLDTKDVSLHGSPGPQGLKGEESHMHLPPPPVTVSAIEEPSRPSSTAVPPPLASRPSEGSRSLDVNTQELFNRMHEHFEQCMVMKLVEGKLIAEKWDNHWSLDPSSKGEIEFHHPSIFKIVLETHSPYHGYMRPSPDNDFFFRKWNRGRYPEHVTVLPLLEEGHVFGMIVGLTVKAKADLIALNAYQAIAAQYAVKIKRNQAA